jgi:hypothetical protein
MTEWIIERGHMIPVVDRTTTPNSELRAAFTDMTVGESLFTRTIDRMRLANAYMKVSYAKRYSFVSRAMDGGVRVWRVA